MKTKAICRDCGIELNSENWYPSCQKIGNYICKTCHTERVRQWQIKNPEKAKAIWTRVSRKHGHHPFDEDRECSMFLGVHVAEQVLSHVFKDVEKMPMHNPGFDLICNHNKLIDVKSACKRKDRNEWQFNIRHNPIADYFLMLAFDNREDLNPMYVWLVPSEKVNHLMTTSISQSTIHKWDAYRLDISKISQCCDAMRTAIPAGD